jgi:hypothetical protein
MREGGMPKDKDRDLPSTLQKSPAKAKRTYRKAHDSAVDSYGEGQRALPGGRAYENVQDVWAALGGAVEHRF